MRPWFQTIFAMYRRGEALTPMVAWEMRTHILDGGRVDKTSVFTSIICDAKAKLVRICTPYILRAEPL